MINKNWYISQVEPKGQKMFNSFPAVAFKRNKNLRDFLGGNKLHNNQKLIHVKTINKEKCHSCLTRTTNFCCK